MTQPAKQLDVHARELHGQNFIVKIAQNEMEVACAQKLRYQVFYEEFGAHPSPSAARQKRDVDVYDRYADHLLVIDKNIPDKTKAVVGTYRLLREDVALNGGFYTETEFDLDILKKNYPNLLEVGRSCIAPAYRHKRLISLLWNAIAHYVRAHDISIMFGCASFHTTDTRKIQAQLAYLYQNHLAPPHMRAHVLADRRAYVGDLSKINVPHEAGRHLPPLLKGYLRLGGHIGEGVMVDKDFNTTDVLIIVPTATLTRRYISHYLNDET